MAKGYIGLTRYSPRPGDIVRWSEDNQRDDILAWAAEKGEPIVDWRHSRFVSGDDSERFDLVEITGALKRADARGVVCADLSRWSRDDVPTFFSGLQKVLQAGYEVRWVSEDWLNLGQPFAWTMLSMLVERNHEALKEIRRKSSAGVRQAQSRGIWVGRIPFGWERAHRLDEEPDGKPRPGVNYGIRPNHRLRGRVTRIYELRRDGHSWHDIERREGIDEQTIRGIVSAERNREVVGDELWAAAQRPGPTFRSDSRGYLLSGLLVCPWCGNRLIGSAVKGWETLKSDRTIKIPRYLCKTWRGQHPWRGLSEKRLMSHVLPVLDAMTIAPAQQAEVATRVGRPDREVEAIRRRVARERAGIESKRRRIEDRLADDLIRPERAREMLAELDDRASLIVEPPPPGSTVAADLSILASLGTLIREVDWPDDRQGIVLANMLLREVIARITWPDRAVKYRPKVELNPRYAAIWTAVSGGDRIDVAEVAVQ